MYRSAVSGRFYVFVRSHDGRIRQFRLFPGRGNRVDATPVRTFDVGGRTEGCVADDATGELYIGEEKRGIWRYGAGRQRTSIDRTGRRGHLTADVEGLALADLSRGSRYLIASDQPELVHRLPPGQDRRVRHDVPTRGGAARGRRRGHRRHRRDAPPAGSRLPGRRARRAGRRQRRQQSELQARRLGPGALASPRSDRARRDAPRPRAPAASH